MRFLTALIAALALLLAGCGDDDDGGDDVGSGGGTAPKEQGSQERLTPSDSGDPVARAETYAREQFPEATNTDDSLAAAVSGCYAGITGDYLGGPDSWSIEKGASIEYPESDLRAIFDRAEKDCAR